MFGRGKQRNPGRPMLEGTGICLNDTSPREARGLLRGNHLSGIDHDVAHHEASDQDRGGDHSGDPGIVLPEFDMLYVMGDQLVDLERQGKEDPDSNHKYPEQESKFTAHDEVDRENRASRGDIQPKDKQKDRDD